MMKFIIRALVVTIAFIGCALSVVADNTTTVSSDDITVVSLAECCVDKKPVDSGVWSLSGGISYSKISNDDMKYSLFTATPSIYYFVWSNVAFGAVANYNRYSYDSVDVTDYGIGPVFRLYFGSGKESVYPFLSAGLIYYKTETDCETVTKGGEENEISIGCGLDIMLSKNIAFEPFVGYRMINHDSHIDFDDTDETRFVVGVGISTFIF